MADFIQVDTARVAAAAKGIARCNNKIKQDFAAVESAMKALDSSWEGEASASAMHSFYEIKHAYYEPQYQVIQNFVNFLQQQVDPGYTQTEQTNTSLADAFK
ncbi:WXG100 family type VII secretion target [Ectobacillus ponti]|uniref:WXG100 family type VII secretion target n=1 Tax=Ectobacillus ponti TaxID=2961894 RepID=A0AA41X920_9BACI|nr:WXG100 family type VII secretion target [Ectobacillus ponti]MCP8969378.1 WXG100 family type VII secretion target [Ectobacillus ponti]